MYIHRAALILPLIASSLLFADGGTAPVRKTHKAADGLNIAYDVRGKGDTALVFIHGWCGDRAFWKHQLDVFSGDHTVIALDLAGHGASGKNRKVWKIVDLSSDVASLIKAEGVTRVILIGHSMGGPISLDVARRLPGVVVGIVGVDTLSNAEYKFPADQVKTIQDSFNADFQGTLNVALKGMLPEKVNPELERWLIAKAEIQDPKMAIGLFQDFPNLDTPAMMKNAKVPIRCINSAPASQFAIPTAIGINKKYADFDAVIMAGVGHFPMLEKPTEFNEKMRSVLKGFAPKK